MNVGIQIVLAGQKETIYLLKNIFILFCTQSFSIVALSLYPLTKFFFLIIEMFHSHSIHIQVNANFQRSLKYS